MARLRAESFSPSFTPFHSHFKSERRRAPVDRPYLRLPTTIDLGEMMSAQKIRAALGLLQDDPDNEASYNDLVEAVTSPDAGMSPGELRALLESARHAHEMRREWDAVARLLELEIGLQAGTPVEFAMQFELARVFEDELFDDERAMGAYRRLQQLRPDDPTASEAIEPGTSKRRKWKELVQALGRSRASHHDTFKSSLLMSAGEVGYRCGKITARRGSPKSPRSSKRATRSTPRTSGSRRCSSDSTAGKRTGRR